MTTHVNYERYLDAATDEDVARKINSRLSYEPDGCTGWAGSHTAGGYATLCLPGRIHLYVHRIRWTARHPDAKAPVIDHICTNRGCVNPDHLRAATKSLNAQNRGANSTNPSGARGVAYCKRTDRWLASMEHQGHKYFLGRHAEIDNAALITRVARFLSMPYAEQDKSITPADILAAHSVASPAALRNLQAIASTRCAAA